MIRDLLVGVARVTQKAVKVRSGQSEESLLPGESVTIEHGSLKVVLTRAVDGALEVSAEASAAGVL